ncbi:MAG: prepilin peptidase [Rhodocyclaceae bacterium]|nr:prepilin peptidase [Rhodocyclaceae bacterium]
MTSVGWAFVVGYEDLSHRRIPNVLTFGAAFIAIAYFVVAGTSPLGASSISVLSGLGLALVLTVPGYFLHQLGAGDVKLLLAIALLGGAMIAMVSFVVAAVTMGAAIAARASLRPWFGVPASAGRYLPFGAALALGFVVATVGGEAGLFAAFSQGS